MKSPNAARLRSLLDSIQPAAQLEQKNIAKALVDFANENFKYITDLADAYDERDAER